MIRISSRCAGCAREGPPLVGRRHGTEHGGTQVLFDTADADDSGGLDCDEFLTVLQCKTLNLKLSPEETEEIKRAADRDADGVITFEEFVPVVEQLLNRVRAKKAKKKARGMWAVAGAVAASNGTRLDFATVASIARKVEKAAPSALNVFQLRRQGLRAYRRQQHDEAEAIMRSAVEMARKIKENSTQHLSCTSRLGEIVLARGRVREAVLIFEDCLKRLREVHGQRGHRSVGRVLPRATARPGSRRPPQIHRRGPDAA